jgi:hypothetical protein
MFAFVFRAHGEQHLYMDGNSHKQGRIFWREFLYLWVPAAAVAALSLPLMHLPQAGLARQLFIPFHSETAALTLIAVITQNSIQLAISIGVGLVAARRVGLGAPVLEAWLRGEPVGPHLRAPIVPILMTGLLFVVCSTLTNSSAFHPNRRQDAAAANEMLNSTASAKMMEQVDKLGLVGTKSVTPVSLIISDLANAIDGEINTQLFEVSVIILLLVQMFGKPNLVTDSKFFWAAILIVVLVHTANYLLMQHESTLLYSGLFKSFGLPSRIDPFWLVAARASVRIVPTGVALGLLYVRYGIETSIVASFGAAVANHLFTIFWFTHFS